VRKHALNRFAFMRWIGQASRAGELAIALILQARRLRHAARFNCGCGGRYHGTPGMRCEPRETPEPILWAHAEEAREAFRVHSAIRRGQAESLCSHEAEEAFRRFNPRAEWTPPPPRQYQIRRDEEGNVVRREGGLAEIDVLD
jgi:hypothetical protein